MAGIASLALALYLYMLGRVYSEEGQRLKMEADETRKKWKDEEHKAERKMEKLAKKHKLERRVEEIRGIEFAGTKNGGIAAPNTPKEDSEEDGKGPQGKEGNSKKAASKIPTVFSFLKRKKD